MYCLIDYSFILQFTVQYTYCSNKKGTSTTYNCNSCTPQKDSQQQIHIDAWKAFILDDAVRGLLIIILHLNVNNNRLLIWMCLNRALLQMENTEKAEGSSDQKASLDMDYILIQLESVSERLNNLEGVNSKV